MLYQYWNFLKDRVWCNLSYAIVRAHAHILDQQVHNRTGSCAAGFIAHSFKWSSDELKEGFGVNGLCIVDILIFAFAAAKIEVHVYASQPKFEY